MTRDHQPPRTPHAGNGSSPDSQNSLQRCRQRLDRIDRQLVELLARRNAEVADIADFKKRQHLPVYHPAREEDLIDRSRTQAREMGLSPDFVEDLFRRILHQSRENQTLQMARKSARPGATVLLVGGRGEMGRYFQRWFAAAGYRVRALNRNDWPAVDGICRGVDLVLVSVPIETTIDIIHRLGPHLPPGCVLADITSIKEQPLEAMLASHRGPVVGLHPLFGPTTSTMDKQIVAVTPGRGRTACQWVLDQFKIWGAILVEADAREHDDVMGIVQALRHFATYAFGRFLSRRDIDLARSLEFSSPIYRLELGMVGRLFAQDPGLYAEIILADDRRRELLADYVQSLNESLALVANGDRQGFISEFEKIARWFGPFGDQAIRESSYLIDKLIERF